MVRKIVAFWILVLGFSFSNFSQGIYTLRKKIIFSSYALVVNIDNPDYYGVNVRVYDEVLKDSIEVFCVSIGDNGRADLYIKKRLKGEISTDSVLVRYGQSNKSPNYPNKKEALVFLGKIDSLDSYYTIGVIPVDSLAELNWLVHQVEALLKIEQIPFKRKQNMETTEWLVQCVENKYTRWDGAYELSRKRHWISDEDCFKDEKHRKYLTKDQKERLEKVFFENDTIGFTELCLSDFVSKKRNSKLKERLLLNLKIAVENDYFFFVEALMQKYVDVEKNKQLREVYKEFKKLSFDRQKEQLKKLTRQFIDIGEETLTGVDVKLLKHSF